MKSQKLLPLLLLLCGSLLIFSCSKHSNNNDNASPDYANAVAGDYTVKTVDYQGTSLNLALISATGNINLTKVTNDTVSVDGKVIIPDLAKQAIETLLQLNIDIPDSITQKASDIAVKPNTNGSYDLYEANTLVGNVNGNTITLNGLTDSGMAVGLTGEKK